jgi:hypothetical protein
MLSAKLFSPSLSVGMRRRTDGSPPAEIIPARRYVAPPELDAAFSGIFLLNKNEFAHPHLNSPRTPECAGTFVAKTLVFSSPQRIPACRFLTYNEGNQMGNRKRTRTRKRCAQYLPHVFDNEHTGGCN